MLLFLLYTGTHPRPLSTIAIYKTQKSALRRCKQELRPSYDIVAERQGYKTQHDEDLIDESTQVIEISGPAREYPYNRIAFTIQRCETSISLQVSKYLQEKHQNLEKLWVTYDMTTGKIWRVHVDEAGAEIYRLSSHGGIMDILANKTVEFWEGDNWGLFHHRR
ncbi:MAG: hypothetical protein Q9221_003548 [Calogaya cf. arnoldii]